MGCAARWRVAATDAIYPMAVALADGSQLPPGAALVEVARGRAAAAELRWTPRRGAEGSAYVVCFVAFANVTYGSRLAPGVAQASAAAPEGVAGVTV